MTSQQETMDIQRQFEQQFHDMPTHVTRAPGRVNLIGEHTDYNLGLVLPMAIEQQVQFCFRRRDDQQVHLYSTDFEQHCKFSLDDELLKDTQAPWADYVKATAAILQADGRRLRGFDAVVQGNIPIASGLSSSAALEVAAVLTFAECGDFAPGTPWEVAKIAQRAENDFVGVACGLMDQLISAGGQPGHAMMIDFATESSTPIEISDDVTFVIGDSKLSRRLAGSAYNDRRSECEAATEKTQAEHPEWDIRHLSQLTLKHLPTVEAILPRALIQRVQHVVTENDRVRRATSALQAGDVNELGRLFSASHASLRDDYLVSSDGLNQLVDLMESASGCAGARLTGAGFGGCTVAVLHSDQLSQFLQEARELLAQENNPSELFVARPSAGASVSSV